MFNLLRRSKNKRSKQSHSPTASRKSTAAAATERDIATANGSLTTAATGSEARYGPRWGGERERERSAALPTAAAKSLITRRAAIEELEDLEDLNDADDDEGEGAEMAGGRGGASSHDDGGSFYFNRCRRERAPAASEQAKVNLDRTAADFMPNVAPPRRAAKASAPHTSSSSGGHNSNSNSATKPNSNPFAFSQFDAARINTIAGAVAFDAGDGRAGCGPREAGDRGAPTALSTSATAIATASQNEEAAWPGHVLPLAKRKYKIDRYIADRGDYTPNQSNRFNNSHLTATAALTAEDAQTASDDTAATATAASRTINSNGRNNSNTDGTVNDDNDDNGNGNDSSNRNHRPIPSPRVRATADTVINEVKYRNLGSTTTTASKSSEAKRQSRLSLTLGLGRTSGKSKSVEHESNAHESADRQVKKSTRKSFLYGRSKSIEKESPDNRPTVKQPLTSKLSNKENANDRATRAIQKSKEFLSEIFMARGRNHNRSRNQQQQHQQQSSQQLTQHQHQQAPTPTHPSPHPRLHPQPQPSQAPSKYAPVRSAIGGNHNKSIAPIDPVTCVNHNSNSNGGNSEPHSAAHLETISDPLSISTNSYQMTTSNNSAKNASRVVAVDRVDRERQQRSNSAEREERNREAAWTRRALSADSQYTGAPIDGLPPIGDDQQRQQEELVSAPALNTVASVERAVIHEHSAALNGIRTAKIDETAIEQDQDDRNASTHRASDNVGGTNANQIKTNAADADTAFVFDRAPNTGDPGDRAKRADGNAAVELTRCERDSVFHGPPDTTTTITTNTTNTIAAEGSSVQIDAGEACKLASAIAATATSMGQASAKYEEAPNSRAGTPRQFRESVIPEGVSVGRPPVVLPKITVVDCSGASHGAVNDLSGHGSPVEHEIFYDFEDPAKVQVNDRVDITPVEAQPDENDGMEDEVFHEQQIPTTVYQNKWSPSHSPLRYNPSKLENVPEQEEDEEDEEDSDDVDAGVGVDADGDGDEHNLDREFAHGNFDSPERNPLKSTNTSDSNLSNSFPDSGIGSDSQYSRSSPSPSSKHAHADRETAAAASTSARARMTPPPLQQQQQQQRLPFVRDGYSTDCDETLLQCDDLDYATVEVVADPNARLVCIESISLPDVVVESTTGASGGASTSASATTGAGGGGGNAGGGGEQIININGATGNSMGNVHFIPIHVEGDSGGGSGGSQSKRRSVDDSVLGGGMKSFNRFDGLYNKSTIEITEDATELDCGTPNGYNNNGLAEKLKRELLDQKSRHNSQLGDAQKNVQKLQAKVAEMQTKIEKLEQELSTKAWKVERLQSELRAAQQDDDCVRKRLKSLEEEKTNLRHQYSEDQDEFKRKYEELETQYRELEVKYTETKLLASNLQTQLAMAQSEAEEWRREVDQIRVELEEQIRILKNALENSEAERKICQDKWQKEFEMLRTQNQDREETLMTDCEWQMRQMQRQCKDKIDKAVQERQMALEKTEALESELAERQQQVNNLKVYQAEVTSLRGVVSEQEHAIQTLMDQIENMRTDLHTTKTSLDQQMQAVKKIKCQCDNALCDKEREVVYRINEVRNQAAAFWEDKLYTEMTRLKTELESVYVDERRDALDKLQAEHIEELRALTTRYTANEDELRVEFNELQERYERRTEEFMELREKSDNALLQTRMHLDRADREYQNAMCREEERREALEESLRKEFEVEKADMEEKFRERLNQVKEEFAKELQNSTQEMTQKYLKDLEQQKAKLRAEKDEAVQELNERHRKRLAAAEEQIKEIELRHQHDLKDLKAAYDVEKTSLDKRDLNNANEIEQLHRKCRCLTNLFEEMRMRYERRDPRPEDLREIAELRSRCESQERDLYVLTDQLRELQMQVQISNGADGQTKGKAIKKPPPKTIPTSCDVIYEEENEERESPPPSQTDANPNSNEEDEDEEEETEDESEDGEEDEVEAGQKVRQPVTADVIISTKKIGSKTKNIDTINEDDESHMITAV